MEMKFFIPKFKIDASFTAKGTVVIVEFETEGTYSGDFCMYFVRTNFVRDIKKSPQKRITFIFHLLPVNNEIYINRMYNDIVRRGDKNYIKIKDMRATLIIGDFFMSSKCKDIDQITNDMIDSAINLNWPLVQIALVTSIFTPIFDEIAIEDFIEP